jgi:hypothetical protein
MRFFGERSRYLMAFVIAIRLVLRGGRVIDPASSIASG